MIQAINKKDFNKYGCISCGCNYASSYGYFSSTSSLVICPECNTKYVILENGYNESDIGYPIDSDSLEYPKLIEHPRKGIRKHKLVIPDLKPDIPDGDYMISKGTLFRVTNIKAAKRILKLFKKYNQTHPNSPFKCELIYDSNNPLDVNIKINSTDKIRRKYLENAIKENNNIITPNILEYANQIPKDFANNWKYGNKDMMLKTLINQRYLHLLLKQYSSDQTFKEHDRDESKNILLMCETLGINSIINNSLTYYNDYKAKELLKSFNLSLQNGYYNHVFTGNQFNKTILDMAIETTKEILNNEVLDQNKRFVFNYDTVNEKRNADKIINNIIPRLKEIIDFKKLEMANINIMYSISSSTNIVNYLLTGLYLQIERDIATNNYQDIVNATFHTYYSLKYTYSNYYIHNKELDDLLNIMFSCISNYRYDNDVIYSMKKDV